jgi:3-mercaptopyruvate sulfurtransferase SseA
VKQHIVIALLVLLASSVVGATVNRFRSRPLPWIREDLAAPVAAPAPAAPVAEKGPTTSQPRGASPTAAVVAAKPGTVAIDAVLKHLADGTAYFIDARSDEDYEKGHLKGALHLPSESIYQRIEEILKRIPPVEKVIVYCGGGDCEASHNVADALRRDFGFADVLIYEKGWQEVMSKPDRFAGLTVTGVQP